MGKTKIDSEARRLVISIGLHIEQWIVDHARNQVERRSTTSGHAAIIDVDDIKQSLEAFIHHGAPEIKASLVQNEGVLHTS